MEIFELIPQRAPMILIDKFMGITEGISSSKLTIVPQNIFVEEGILTECGIIEHIAQSAAARVGFVSKMENKPIAIGYIGAVANYESLRNPKLYETICTKIEIQQEVFNITLISAKCFVEEELIASCQMKIFLDV